MQSKRRVKVFRLTKPNETENNGVSSGQIYPTQERSRKGEEGYEETRKQEDNSPILAHFQKRPKKPSLLRSTSPGAAPRM